MAHEAGASVTRLAALALAALVAVAFVLPSRRATASDSRTSVPLFRGNTGQRVCAATPGAAGGYWFAAHCLRFGPLHLLGEARRVSIDPVRDLAHMLVEGAAADETATVREGDLLEVRSDRATVALRYVGGAWCSDSVGVPGTTTIYTVPTVGTWDCGVACHDAGRNAWGGDSGAGAWLAGGGPLYGIVIAADLNHGDYRDDPHCGERQRVLLVPVP